METFFTKGRLKWLSVGVSTFVVVCGALVLIGRYGSGSRFLAPLASRLNTSFDAIVSYVSTEAGFVRHSTIDGWLKGQDKSIKIGWVSDIHADRFKRRDVPSGLMFPRQYKDYLPKVFDAMRQQGITTVIATGDNTNSGDDNYARALVEIAQQKKMQVVWVRGNHDTDEVMSLLGVNGKNYYFVDYENTRIIVLDDTEGDSGYTGAIEQEQMDWLKQALNTKNQVIVTMHIPIFDEEHPEMVHDIHGGNLSAGNLLDHYTQLESLLHESGNVKMVLSGHWHVPWQKEYDGINYYGEAALTRESYSGAYAVIDLKNDTVEYLFAK